MGTHRAKVLPFLAMARIVPYHTAATALKTIIDTEFPDRAVAAQHDKLHESLGYDKLDVGISPIEEAPMPTNEVTNQLLIFVQWYDVWEKLVDNAQQVNPFPITDMADRFRRAVRRQQATADGSDEVWFFKVLRIQYPDDPTGNKTRFEATILVYGNNTGLVETGGA